MAQISLLQPPLTLAQLEAHLWEAANILRGGPVDRIASQDISLSIPLYVKRAMNGGNGAEATDASLPALWAAWEQEGRAFWLEMDALVESG